MKVLSKVWKNVATHSKLPNSLESQIVQTGTKLSTRFNIKDKVDKNHLSNFIYRRKCRNKRCKDSYVGETARRRTVRTGEHGGKDKNSWIFKHSSKTKHPRAKDEDFEILATNYGDRRKRKLAEAMFIRDLKPSLNKQKESFKLALFAWRHDVGYLTSKRCQCNRLYIDHVVTVFHHSLNA